MQADKQLSFYSRQGIMSEPDSFGYLLDPLPSDATSLCKILHGVMAIDLWVRTGTLQVPAERHQEFNLRSVRQKLQQMLALDNQPLAAARAFEKRLLGNCRDLSLLMCAILRHHGVPARVRSGFATFFDPVRRFDHWICEYWRPEAQRWVGVDMWMSQVQQEQERLDPALRAGLSALLDIGYDPLDVGAERFLTGAQAWQRCRLQGEDPNLFGSYGDLQGLWFMRDNLLRDFLCLNGIEVLPWDCWGRMSGKRESPPVEELEQLDHIAAVTEAGAGNGKLAEVLALFEEMPDLHPQTECAV
jgi:hypothetical protein